MQKLMKFQKTAFIVLVLLISPVLTIDVANAQLRSEVPSPYIVKSPTVINNGISSQSSELFGLQNFRMAHSYEMSVGSFGGDVYTQNMYTNTMFLDINDRLNGRVDLAFAHSPFGNALPGMNQSGQIFVRNAELNYALSERTHFSVQFRQIPGGMGYYGANRYGYSPFHSNRFNSFYNPY